MPTLFDMEPRPEGSGLTPNEAQRRAITHGEGPLLVIAGAGTGKTRVITERIRHLLESDASLLGENILGLTFTKKAAGEMKASVVKAVGERGKDVVLATFHSFCETLLKEVDPNRVPLESVDHWILLRRNLARLKLEKYRRLAEPGQFLSDFIRFSRVARTNWYPAKNTRPTPINLRRNWRRNRAPSTKTPARSAPSRSHCNRRSPAPTAPAKKS